MIRLLYDLIIIIPLGLILVLITFIKSIDIIVPFVMLIVAEIAIGIAMIKLNKRDKVGVIKQSIQKIDTLTK